MSDPYYDQMDPAGQQQTTAKINQIVAPIAATVVNVKNNTLTQSIPDS